MDKDRVSVYATTESGRDTASAIVNSDARLGFEASKSRPPEDYSLEFVDYPFTADAPPEFEDYLPIIKREQPTVAVAPDIEDGRDPNDVFDMADEMANYVEHVVVVPKEIEPAEVPDRFRTGLPLANFGSDSPWEWADFLECESVHVLGGPPQAQRQVVQTYIPVDSVDGATMVKASNFGKVWQWPDTWIEVPWSDFYDRIETSLTNTVAALNGARIADEMPDTPDYDEMTQDPYKFEETRVPPRGPPQCQYYDCENDAIGGTDHTYCDDHRKAEDFFDDLEQQADEIDESIPHEIRTDGGTTTNSPDMSTTENTNGAAGDELPETVGDFHRLETESITLDHNTGNIDVAYSPEDTNDLAYLEDTGNGWNAWFLDEASVGTLEMDTDLDVSIDDIRLGYAETRSEALPILLTALEENTARELRLGAREDTEFEVVGADHTSLQKVTYPDVKGKRAETLEAYYDTDEEIGEASDDELLALSGIGPKTVEGVRKQINGESTDDESGIDLSDVGIEPSGITFDDPITEITGVGDSSDLITGDGVETVGEWWEIGVPFYGVAGGWHDSALEDILGAEFVDEDDPQDLMRIFTGYTAGTVYDRDGEKLGGLPSALFEMFDWEESAWAWYIANQRPKQYRPDEAETPGGTYQFAFATGEDVPREALSFDPDEDSYAGLERVGNATVPEGEFADPVVKYNAAEVDGVAAPPRPTVEFVSTLFGTDYSDPDIAREHVEIVVVPGSSGTRTSEYVALFHHPTAPAHAMIEGDNLVMPEDFDLEGEVYDPIAEFDHIEERGPTMNRPVPEEEEYTLPMSPLDRRQLEDTGLAPSDFEIIDGAMAPENVHEKGYHPADQDRDRDVAPDVVAEDLAQQRDHEQNAEAAEAAGVYDPTTEFDELEEPTEISAIGDGRRSTIDAIDAKDRLDDVQTFNTIDELTNAVRELSLARRDGRTYMSPPEDVIDSLESYYQDLPDEAQREYLNDHVIHRRVNAARKAFNRWMGKKKREQEIPSAMEAGPSNYPTKKAQETSRYAREGNEELKERIDRVRAAAKGAHQRALESIGTSVAERNQQKAESKMERRRREWVPGDIVVYRNPNLQAGGIVRLNEKSVRAQTPNPHQGSDIGPDGEYRRETVDLDTNRLDRLSKEEYAEADPDEYDIPNLDPLPETYDAARRELMGDEWVDENLDDADHDRGEDPHGGGPLDDEDREQIRTHVGQNDLDALLVVLDAGSLSQRMDVKDHFETISGLLDHYDEHGHFKKIRGIGPATSETFEAAVPLIREANEDDGPALEPHPGDYKNQRMADAHYWAAQLLGWMKEGPNAGLRGSYYVDIIGGKPVLVMDADEWNESNVQAIKDALRDHDFPQPLRINEGDDAVRLFISEPTDDRLPTDWYPDGWRSFEATGGHGGDLGARFHEDQLDTWDTSNPATDDQDDGPALEQQGTTAVDATIYDPTTEFDEPAEPDREIPDELGGIKGLGRTTEEKFIDRGIETPEDLAESWANKAHWLGQVKPILRQLPSHHSDNIGGMAAQMAHDLGLERDDDDGPMKMVDKDGNPLSDRVGDDEDDGGLEWEGQDGPEFDTGDTVDVQNGYAEGTVRGYTTDEMYMVETPHTVGGGVTQYPADDLEPIDGITDPIDADHEQALDRKAERQLEEMSREMGELQSGARIARRRAEDIVRRHGSLENAVDKAITDPDSLTDIEGIGEGTKDSVIEFAKEHRKDQHDGETTVMEGVGSVTISDDEPVDPDETIVLVGCGKAKKNGVHKAKNLYSSDYFEKKRLFAERNGDRWFVLSAEHGLVEPDEEIEDYEAPATEFSAAERDEWAERVRTELQQVSGIESAHVVMLAGKAYREPIDEEIAALAAEYSSPFEPTNGIGEQIKWLGDNTPDTEEEFEEWREQTHAAITWDVQPGDMVVIGYDSKTAKQLTDDTFEVVRVGPDAELIDVERDGTEYEVQVGDGFAGKITGRDARGNIYELGTLDSIFPTGPTGLEIKEERGGFESVDIDRSPQDDEPEPDDVSDDPEPEDDGSVSDAERESWPYYECSECDNEVGRSPMHPGDSCMYCGGDMEITDHGEVTDESTPTIYAAEKDRWPLLKPYDHSTNPIDDLPGIGKTTRDKIDAQLAGNHEPTIPTLAALANEEADVLRDVGDTLPSNDALETLIQAIEQQAEKQGNDPGATHLLREGYNGTGNEEQQDASQSDAASSEGNAPVVTDHREDAPPLDIPDDLTDITGIGPKTTDRLTKAGISTPKELGRAYAEPEEWNDVSSVLDHLSSDYSSEINRHAAEIAGSVVEHDRALGERYHRSRSPESQNLDEAIDAQKQTTSFATWIKAPNMMDLIGVDNIASKLGVSPSSNKASEALATDGGIYDPTKEGNK